MATIQLASTFFLNECVPWMLGHGNQALKWVERERWSNIEVRVTFGVRERGKLKQLKQWLLHSSLTDANLTAIVIITWHDPHNWPIYDLSTHATVTAGRLEGFVRLLPRFSTSIKWLLCCWVVSSFWAVRISVIRREITQDSFLNTGIEKNNVDKR